MVHVVEPRQPDGGGGTSSALAKPLVSASVTPFIYSGRLSALTVPALERGDLQFQLLGGLPAASGDALALGGGGAAADGAPATLTAAETAGGGSLTLSEVLIVGNRTDQVKL